jgi:hypothetical protein
MGSTLVDASSEREATAGNRHEDQDGKSHGKGSTLVDASSDREATGVKQRTIEERKRGEGKHPGGCFLR